MKTVRNFAAVLIAVVALAWVSTFAVAPSILPDFLRPAPGWRDLVPNFFTPASATAIGVPPVQGAPGMFPFSIASPTDTSPGATSISTNCTSINACSAGSFAQIDVTGQVASGFKCVHSTFSGTLVGDCSGDSGTSWVNGFLVTATGPAASVVVAASSATDNYGIACISLGKVNKVRIRNTVSPTNTTSCTPTTGTYADQGSIFADAASPPNLNQDLQRIAGTTVLNGGVAGSLGVGGLAANGATAAGNPLEAGGIARATSAAPTQVTAGQASALTTDLEHRLWVAAEHPNGSSCIVDTASASTQCVGLSGSGLSYYIKSVTYSASAAITFKVTSSTTAGNACATSPTTVIPTFWFAANTGAPITFPQPIKVTSNSALCCLPSGASGSCIIAGYIAP